MMDGWRRTIRHLQMKKDYQAYSITSAGKTIAVVSWSDGWVEKTIFFRSCGNAYLAEVMTSQSMACGWSSLASCSVSYGDMARHEGAEGTKLACHKAMCLGTGVPKTKGCQIHKACMSQGNVFRHGDVVGHESAEGDIKCACCKAMCLRTRVPKA
ncbi:hypothetical protein ACE6H2_028275 [Prunus campanulata]